MKTDARLSPQQLVAATKALCSPPLIYNRLNDAMNHPRTSLQDIARIISEDQGLTARLLKLANSPLYGFSRVDSINRAVTLIGTREIRHLALAISVMESFPGVPRQLMAVADHWRHSVACAIIARNIAFFLREANVERFFVAGILHDVGRLVLCLTLPERLKPILTEARQGHRPLHSIEQEQLGFDHAELGGALLTSWNLPDNIAQPIAFHHQPSQSCRYQREATIIHVADLICQALAYAADPDTPVTRLDGNAWARLDFPLNALEAVVKQSELQLGEILAAMQEPS